MITALKSARNCDDECRYMKNGAVDSVDENLPLVNGWRSEGSALPAPEGANFDIEVGRNPGVTKQVTMNKP